MGYGCLSGLVLGLSCSAFAFERPVTHLAFDAAAELCADRGSAPSAFMFVGGSVLFEPKGVRGGCAYFIGGPYLAAPQMPEGFPRGTDAYAVSAWIRVAPDCASSGGWVSWGALEAGRGNSLRLAGPDAIHNYWNDRDLTVGAKGLGNGLWHHVVATGENGRRAVYMDGTLLGEDGATPNVGAGAILVGKTMHDVAFRGWVDELKVWKRAFSANEVRALWQEELSPAARANDLPVAQDVWPLDAAKGAILYGGFTVRLKIDLDGVRGDEPLYEAGSAKLAIRMVGRDKAPERDELSDRDYRNFPLPDGTCPVLEAMIVEQAGRVGIPLGALANAGDVHEVTLDFSPVKWSILVDGLVDETIPIPAHPVKWPDNAVQRKLSNRVKSTTFLTPSRHAEVLAEPDAKPIGRSLQYWTPDGFNTWVGDVAPAFLDGKLHVFYLLDRRHHGGGCGTGRHQFAHLATDDLIHWVEHPLAVPITEPWQTVGTGTPFMKDGKLAIAFGWHTSRYPEMKGMPLGGTYAISDDGIRFRNSGRIISDAQNPSIYNRADGSYELVTSYGGSIGIFRSTDLIDWKLYDAKLPFRGDCPSLFDWHGHRYLLQGFVNMAYSPDGRPGSFVNWSAEPDKLYDGLCVPMVTRWKGDRRLYIGWLNHIYGWGGWLVFREVVSYPDGHLGLKWVPEIEPPVPPQSHSVKAGGNFTLRFKNKGDGADLLFTIDAKGRTASFADDVPDVKLQEARSGANFRIGGLRGIDGDYDVKLIRYYDAKADVTIFDAEIAGQRTMVCRRRGRFE